MLRLVVVATEGRDLVELLAFRDKYTVGDLRGVVGS